MKVYYDQVGTQIADQKAREKQIQSIMLGVAGTAPNDVLAQISQAGSVLEATQIANPYLGGTTGTGGGGTIPTEEPLSINQVEQFRRSYGWTPPLGFTNDQLIQYMNDNPGATPEELEAGARQSSGGEIEQITPQTNFPDTVGHIMNTITDDERNALFAKAKAAGVTKALRLKRGDVKAYVETLKAEIEEAISQGYSKEEIKQVILGL